ncbi:MFS transporter [Nocardioides ferulae]|uniref:MFS transporter n=1 Tax=Nocardioides ferulae TaxID=2340821 RepID=UPI001F0C65A5|nr:MFS transporter [Nocardioides ferulae]
MTTRETGGRQGDRGALRKAATACFIGNFVEWFDYAAYGYLATVIARVFFPDSDATTALLATFGVFALSFVVRPIGGIFWGHVGDRHGRRAALSVSILIMTFASFSIALIPSHATIGLLAPALLLVARLAQGFSASGEYAGASAFLAEYAPEGQRGRYTSIVPASTATGLLFGSLSAALLHGLLDDPALESWGWRLPFLLAAPLGLIGRYIRLHLEDTPRFCEMQARREQAPADEHAPIRLLLTEHRRAVVIAFGVTSLNAVAFYLLLSYLPTYLTTELDVSETEAFTSSTIALAAYIAAIFGMGRLSDALGRRTMLVAASVLFLLASVPLFVLAGQVGIVALIGIQVVFGVMLTMNDGTLPVFLSEIFPTSVRYSGFAFSFNSANALFGGTAPLVATWLISVTGSVLAPAWYLTGIALLALVAMLASRETAHEALRD